MESAPKRILLVEDEAAIRQMLAFNLKRAGFELDEAEDCRSARQRIVDARPDPGIARCGERVDCEFLRHDF